MGSGIPRAVDTAAVWPIPQPVLGCRGSFRGTGGGVHADAVAGLEQRVAEAAAELQRKEELVAYLTPGGRTRATLRCPPPPRGMKRPVRGGQLPREVATLGRTALACHGLECPLQPPGSDQMAAVGYRQVYSNVVTVA